MLVLEYVYQYKPYFVCLKIFTPSPTPHYHKLQELQKHSSLRYFATTSFNSGTNVIGDYNYILSLL